MSDKSSRYKENQRIWRSELDYFKQHRDEIRDTYGEKEYVAIHKHEIVDHDEDEIVLLRRTREKYPGKVVLITRYDIRKADLRSLEVKRKRVA